MAEGEFIKPKMDIEKCFNSVRDGIREWEAVALEKNGPLLEALLANSLVWYAAYNSEKKWVMQASNDSVADLKEQIA